MTDSGSGPADFSTGGEVYFRAGASARPSEQPRGIYANVTMPLQNC
jgi:hypothetical protein